METKPQVTAPEPEVAEIGGPSRPLRRDAERNRRLILGAAKSVFARRGLEASLDEVAKEAGLGVGTVYRRFPNRDALIDALFDDMVASIKLIAEHASAEPRAWDGLVYFMTAMLETQGHDKGLRDVMIAREQDLITCGPEKGSTVREMVQPMLYDLVHRAQREGDLRPDVAPTDIGVLLIASVGVVEFTAPLSSTAWRRHLAVVLDGLRSRPDGASAPLVEPALDDDEMDACMAGWKYGTQQADRRRA
ncbi:TetR/AcrR family transcriptional regulator [Catenulispora subtropica]|uniref:TetR/AcrR family transcriptional regulator n=1 Tax=Catenulispora subtropica TaxID=450798 RepID=A0ABN2R6Y5_9ACTN